jgi:putative ATPase
MPGSSPSGGKSGPPFPIPTLAAVTCPDPESRPSMRDAHPDLFDRSAERARLAPLAERLRARRLEDVVGQPKLVAPGALLPRLLAEGRRESLIFWGPPGTGKTTVARLLIEASGAEAHVLNAVTSGVADLRRVIAEAEGAWRRAGRPSILFIDEIHRFNKAQQDALLKSVEDGTLTLIAATTENPGFEVIGALLSRCHVLVFEPLDSAALEQLLERALAEDEWLSALQVDLDAEARARLLDLAGGDARRLLQSLELAATVAEPAPGGSGRRITRATLETVLLRRLQPFDKGGDQHYDLASALIKSIRGSDADAGMYWLLRLLEGGEDPVFVARRLLILASEDVGNASPNALVLAEACFEAVRKLGLPEAAYPLAQCVCYLAGQPKSNAIAVALADARRAVRDQPAFPVPPHLRNAPTRLAKELGHAGGYVYPPDVEGSFARQAYLPDGLAGTPFYRPSARGQEGRIRDYLARCWPERFGTEEPR